MGTMTAQILVGTPHSNHDGIQPTHHLFLSENSRPAWVLVPQNIFGEDQTAQKKIVWIPTVENMLEDAFLMIAIHIQKNRKITELANSFYNNMQSDRLEMYEHINESQRKQLYEKCRQIPKFPKIIISVFRGSTIQSQLQIISQYKMDVEVCCTTYSRLFSAWSGKTGIAGSLEYRERG